MTFAGNPTGDFESAVDIFIELYGEPIILRRGSSELSPQRAVVSRDSGSPSSGTMRGEPGAPGILRYTLLGDSSLDIRRGDRFSYNALPAGRNNLTVTAVDRSSRAAFGKTEAYAEERQ